MIGFIGFGEFGKQIYRLAGLEAARVQIASFDDNLTEMPRTISRPFGCFSEYLSELSAVYIGLGYKNLAIREAVLSKVESRGVVAPHIVHASGVVASTAELGSAVYVYPGALLDENVKLGSGTVLNNRVTVSHDSEVGGCSFLAPGVIVCGNVRIGRRTFIGAGSVITNGVSLGDDVTVGAGTVVTKDIASGMTVIGNPMRFLDKNLSIN